MTRSMKITARCDGRVPHAGYRPAQSRRCGKSLERPSHKALTNAIAALGWHESETGDLLCDECLEAGRTCTLLPGDTAP
jgi:hypothetical protein